MQAKYMTFSLLKKRLSCSKSIAKSCRLLRKKCKERLLHIYSQHINDIVVECNVRYLRGTRRRIWCRRVVPRKA